MRLFQHFAKQNVTFRAHGLIASLLVLFFFTCHSPATAKGYQNITAPEVKNMIDNDPKVVVINALSSIEYNGLHIPGSINIPVINFRASKLLPADKTTPIIVYCMGYN